MNLLAIRLDCQGEDQLSRIAGLFARRGFNIESLAVGHAERSGISRLTLEVAGDPGKLLALEQVLAPFGILQIVRTSKISLERASGINAGFLKVSALQKRVPI